VLNTAITFEYDVPTLEEFRSRIENTLKKYPYLVAERNGEIIGYAYAGAFHPRAAFGWSAEVTVYLSDKAKGCGLGRKLYEILEDGTPRKIAGSIKNYTAGNGISIDDGVISANSTVVKICDASGSNASKALSDSLSNYKLVGIYARWNNAQRFGTVMPVELFKTTAVSNTLTIANDTVYLNCYYSNDTTITVQNSYGNISNFYVYGIK
jgi:hypothetical protein